MVKLKDKPATKTSAAKKTVGKTKGKTTAEKAGAKPVGSQTTTGKGAKAIVAAAKSAVGSEKISTKADAKGKSASPTKTSPAKANPTKTNGATKSTLLPAEKTAAAKPASTKPDVVISAVGATVGATEAKSITSNSTSKVKTKMAKKGKSKDKAVSKKDSIKKDAEKKFDKLLDDNEHLKNAVQQIEKQFGDGSIMSLTGDGDNRIRGVSTGSLSLDMALGGQGLPCGRIIEIYGPESSGKTTLALHTIAEAQKTGGIAAFVDAEHAFDPTWAKKLGVQLDTLLVSQPNSGEEAMQIVEMLVKSNSVDVIVVDSVAALVPKKELEGEIGDSHVGLQARLMSQSMRKLTGAIARSKTCTIFINQIREKIGVMFGSPETTPGGRALKFYSSVRIDVRRIGALKDADVQVGQRVKAKIVKNKVAPPFRIAEFDMMHDHGISFEGDVLDLGVVHKIVVRSGAWFKYGGSHIGQGKEKARRYLRENPEVALEIKNKVMAVGGYVEDLAEKLEEAVEEGATPV